VLGFIFGFSLVQAAYLASCMASGDTTKPAKQRNLFPSRHLWIGGLVNATRADILDVFGSFGPIEHFKFIKGRRCAFVDFYRQQDAEVAFNRMQGSCVGTSYIDLGFGKPERASTSRKPPASLHFLTE
jgi:RNA recognition motif-containing protein